MGFDLQAHGIDPQTGSASSAVASYNVLSFEQIRVTAAWEKYEWVLTWGKGQCLAILDDGCDLSDPAWQAVMPWGKKVIATWNSIEGNENCHPVPPGYHGTTVGYPSSLNLNGVHGVAYNKFVAQVRCVTVVHLRQDESRTVAAGLRWVRENHERRRITAVNLSPVDDQRHQEPLPTVVDAELRALRRLGIWVSAPCGNHHYTDGISWPACQPDCFAIGGTGGTARSTKINRDCGAVEKSVEQPPPRCAVRTALFLHRRGRLCHIDSRLRAATRSIQSGHIQQPH